MAERKILTGGLPNTSGVVSVDGKTGKVNLSDTYAGKAIETTVTEQGTQIESLGTSKADKSELFSKKYSDLTGTPDLTQYATTAQLGAKADASALEGKADKSALGEYAKSTDVAGTYATKTEVEGKADQDDLNTLETTVGGKLDKTEAASTYATIETVNGKASQSELNELKASVASGVVYKGSVDSVSELKAKEGTAKVGDMYNCTDDEFNYIWDGSKWDPTAKLQDLSHLAEKSTVDNLTTEVGKKADASALTNLATKDEVSKKADATSVTNLEGKVNGKLDASAYHEAKVVIKDLTLTTSGWSNKKQSLNISAFADCKVVEPTLKSEAQEDAYIADGIRLLKSECTDTALVFSTTSATVSTDYVMTVIGYVLTEATN